MRIITIILLFFPLVMIGQKQYAPLGTTWIYEGQALQCQGNHLQYIVENEVDVDGKDCSVIYSYYANTADPTYVKSPDSLIVWEDSDKVFFLEDSTFYLLYDFSAVVGDTITFYNPSDRGRFTSAVFQPINDGPTLSQIVITDIKDVQIESQQRKQFTTEIIFIDDACVELDTIIENIGTTGLSITGSGCELIPSGCFGGLQCYKNEAIAYETNLQFQTPPPGCDFIDSVDEALYIGNLDIFPNPASDILQVVLPDSGIYSYSVTSMNGRTLLSGTSNDGAKLDVNISNIESGMYLIRLHKDELSYVSKFIKSN